MGQRAPRWQASGPAVVKGVEILSGDTGSCNGRMTDW